ncbi:MAG: S41 family peptidase [Desulfatiglandales bacterium]
MAKKRMRNFLMVLGIVGFLFLSEANWKASSSEDPLYENLRIFAEVLKEIQANYVEDVDPQKLVYSAIEGMVKSLDAHSAFLKKEEYTELMEETKGEFTGIGIEITIKDNTVTVVSPIEDTPAYRAGLKPGDKIIKVDNAPTRDMTLTEVVKRIRGPKGTQVKITIHREGEPSPLEFEITREKIPIQNVKGYYLGSSIGYLRVSSFQNNTSDKLYKIFQDLQKDHEIKGILLDLRNNPGGLLSEAVKVADLFLDEGTIVTTQGRGSAQKTELKARQGDNSIDLPMVVLVNEGSASASEIVAGALQDNKRALIVGTKTFGKGSVQTVIPLSDGSGLRLTTSLYFTPSGRSIQVTGIEPDVNIPAYKPTDLELKERMLREKDLQRHMEKKEEGKGVRGEKLDEPDQNGKILLEKDYQVSYGVGILKGARLFKVKVQ